MEFSRKWENIEINDEILAINSVEKEFYKYCCYFVQFFEARQIKPIQFHETLFWNETNYKRFKRRFNQWWLDFWREIKICFVGGIKLFILNSCLFREKKPSSDLILNKFEIAHFQFNRKSIECKLRIKIGRSVQESIEYYRARMIRCIHLNRHISMVIDSSKKCQGTGMWSV